ncbi:MAG: YraN family protein [Oscillospiraceae bacterium]|nr:YraN family protein [Oscillospiraceae bacterium]
MTTVERGKLGESIALRFLNGKDYVTVATGWRSRFGEIDLIVRNRDFLVFVEVKLRKNANFVHAREYVGKTKQRKIKATANNWLSFHHTKLQPRFDVIEVYMENENSTPQIVHIENAF